MSINFSKDLEAMWGKGVAPFSSHINEMKKEALEYEKSTFKLDLNLTKEENELEL